MTDLEFDAPVLADRLEAARLDGASEAAIVQLLLSSGWRPMVKDSAAVQIVEGRRRDGHVVPVEMHRPNRFGR